MAQNVSLEHTVVTINGHACRGWANAADAFQVPDEALVEVARGADGTMLASSTGNKGGPIMLKFLANSPTHAYLQRQLAQTLRGAVINWELTAENSQAGWRLNAARGVMSVAPKGQTLGNTVAPQRDYTFEFETIIPNYDGASSQEPPVVT